MKEKVFAVACPDYAEAEQKTAELIEMMGGIGKFASAGEKIVLKPNLLAAAEPEKAVTTHPSVITAVARMAKETGAGLLIADSPGSGYPYTEKVLRRTYRITGMTQAAESAGIPLNFDTSHEIVSHPAGERFKRFEVITPVIQADAVLNLCKFKTHGFMHSTGALKNLFGVIAGLTKPGYHAKLKEKKHFAHMLLDLAAYVSPRLSIMDAVVGMEGDGPQNGLTRTVGLLIGSTSALALDVVAGEIMGLPKDSNPVLKEAERRGLKPVAMGQIELEGMDPAQLRIPDFKLPTTVTRLHDRLFAWLHPVFKQAFSVRPWVILERCAACGTCRDACPVNVITQSGPIPARIDDQGCIRCYCCHEMCPHGAIELRAGRLYRLLNRRSA